MLKQIIIVGLGGAIGSMFRYAMYFISKQESFPIATLLINIAGGFLIGVIMGLSLRQNNWTLFLATGICGGFTTFSAFSFENLQLIQNGKITTALLYISLSILLGITATWLGYKLAS